MADSRIYIYVVETLAHILTVKLGLVEAVIYLEAQALGPAAVGF